LPRRFPSAAFTAALLCLAAFAAADSTDSGSYGTIQPDRGVLPPGPGGAAFPDGPGAPALLLPDLTSETPAPTPGPIPFFWVPVELPAPPGALKRSFGGLVLEGAPPPPLTRLEEQKLALARAAIDAAQALAAQPILPADMTRPSQKVAPPPSVPLLPDTAACLEVPFPPLQQLGPTELNAVEKAKCAQLPDRGGRP
jgi:hypothetical protein